MTASKVIEALPNLSQKELKAVKLAIERLLDTKPNQLDEELFQAVVDIIGTKSIGVKAFMKTKAYPVFIENQRYVHELIDRIIGGYPKNKVKTIHLKRFLVSLLISNLKLMCGEPPVMGSVAIGMRDIKGVFEQSFPGYLEAGLTQFILKGLGG